MGADPARYRGWAPLALVRGAAEPTVLFGHGGGAPFTRPFFHDDAAALMRHPFNLLFARRERLADLGPFAPTLAQVRPGGLIYHMSRCGSTLLARLLRALPAHLVYPEPPLLDRALSALRAGALPPAERSAQLRGLVGAMAHYGAGRTTRCFIKLDCWAIHQAELLAAALPEAPALFLYRDPLEVMVSHRRMPGRQMAPGLLDPGLFGMTLAEALALPRDLYGARVLAGICTRAADLAAAGRLTLVNYSELTTTPLSALLERLFGIPVEGAGAALVEEAARTDAKLPGRGFRPDGEAKRAEADHELRALVERELAPIHARLEALRARQRSPLAGDG